MERYSSIGVSDVEQSIHSHVSKFEMLDLPKIVSTVDQESYDQILAVPWLRDSISPTGLKWGRRLADVEMSRLPTHLLGQVMLLDDDQEGYLLDEVLLVVYRWDRYDHQGWEDAFPVTLRFPDGSIYEVEVPPSCKLKDCHSVRIPIGLNTIVRERPQQVERKIPRVIYNLSAPANKQVSQEVRRLLKNVRRITNLLQCTSLYLVLEDSVCQKEVEASGIPGFAEAYNSLRAGSYKADLMRFYMLYKYGGVYFDDKTLLRQSLDSVEFDSIFSGDGSPGNSPCDLFISEHRTPEIAFMGSRRGSPIMLKALETAIKNIIRRDYTDHRLGITGNIMFTKMLLAGGTEAQANETSSPLARDIGARWGRYWEEMCARLPIILSNDGILVRNKFLWRRQAIPTADWPKPAAHYSSLWAQRQVFVDGNPESSTLQVLISSQGFSICLQVLLGLSIVALIGFIISRYPPISWW